MKKLFAVLVLLAFGLFKVSVGQEVPTYGTAEYKKFVKDMKAAQRLNKDGKYEEAVKIAPLNVQKAWYSLNLLREMMGGVLETDGTWKNYNFDSKTLKFTGDKVKCLAQIEVIKKYEEGIPEMRRAADHRILFYCGQYENWIKNGLPKEGDDE